MALIAVCLTVTFVICGRANEGSGGAGEQSQEREGGRDGVAGEGGRNGESEWEGACAHLLCVSCRSAGAEADLFPQ